MRISILRVRQTSPNHGQYNRCLATLVPAAECQPGERDDQDDLAIFSKGTEAMASGGAYRAFHGDLIAGVGAGSGVGRTAGDGRLSQLWQLPLLLLSLGLFGYAAYLFIDPHVGPTVEQRLDTARALLTQERPQAALDLLNRVLDSSKLDTTQQGRIHLMLGESVEMAQSQEHKKIRANFSTIIEQTELALARGIQPDAQIYRRLAESYEGMDQPRQALENYRKAMALDTDHALHIQRKVIDLQLAQDDPSPADATLIDYLKTPNLSDGERAWALGERAQLQIDAGKFADARTLLDQALALATDQASQGEVNYRQGYCAYKLGDSADAERFLRVARDQLTVANPLDADACYLLGKILQERGDAQQALSFYEIVLTSHIDSPIEPLARLGRGTCRILLRQDDPGLADLHDLVTELQQKASRQKFKTEAIVGMQLAEKSLTGRQNIEAALEVLADQQTLQPDPPADFFNRLGNVYALRADQIEHAIPVASAADQIRFAQQVRECRTHAGDAFIAYSRKLTVADDTRYGEALWRGIDLYDHAGDVQRVISALELFVAERPDDTLAPDALLRLGKAYQAAGHFDQAINAFQRNQFRHPNSLAASQSAVPLARAYIAKGPENYAKAETVLLSVINDNPLITPEAEEFRQSLFELAQLYYRTDRFEEAVARLEEFTQRYPTDTRIGQLLFIMADSYRKSALALDHQPGPAAADALGNPPTPDLVEVAAARRDRLTKAKGFYDRVVDTFHAKVPANDIDKLYLKLAYFYRADCLYDMGQYQDSIKLYDSAAFRYQDDPAALAAYVQIVNAYCALGKIDEAKTANERAKWILRRMPADAFKDGAFPMPKEYWAAWLQWTSNAGMW
jgi:tetratricopeptide (TPR) repeat protein